MSQAEKTKVTTSAGTGEPGLVDGPVETAQFNKPDGVTYNESTSALIVTDTGNNAIRQVSEAGYVTTIAGNGTAGYSDGKGSAALFNSPDGITTDSAGNVFVADTGNNAIRKIAVDGTVTTVAPTTSAGPSATGFTDGTTATAKFNAPSGIAVDNAGNIIVADDGNNAIRLISTDGTVTTIAAGKSPAGTVAGSGDVQMNHPHALTRDSDGNVFVTDSENNLIKKIVIDGKSAIVETIAGDGSAGFNEDDVDGKNAKFKKPHGIGNKNGNIYVSDHENSAIRLITPSGNVILYAGNGKAGDKDGSGDDAEFNKPRGIAIDKNENVFVCDYQNNKIKKIEKEK